MASPTVMRILDTARVNASGALDGTMRLEFFNTMKDFLSQTTIWKEFLNIYIDPNCYDYDLVTDSKGVVFMLMGLGRPNSPFIPVTSEFGTPVVEASPPAPGTVVANPTGQASGDFNNDVNADLSTSASQAAYAAQYTPTAYNRAVMEKSPRRGALIASGGPDAILRVFDLPASPELWIADVALTVSDPTDGDGLPFVPDWIVQKYQDAITSGLLSRVMVHPGKPYTNKEAAAYHGRKYMSGVSAARLDARHGANYGGQRWAYPQQFRARTQRSV